MCETRRSAGAGGISRGDLPILARRAATFARRTALALVAATALAAAAAPAAGAADLLVLDGDTVEVGGPFSVGILYVDGTLRLTQDTAITATSAYFGPNARLVTCFIPGTGPGTGENQCTSGRSLWVNSAGPLTFSSGIDLTGGTGPSQPGGSLTLSGGDVAVGGTVSTNGEAAPSGGVSITARGTLETGAVNAPGAAVRLTSAGDLDVAGDIHVEGAANIPQPSPSQAQSAGSVAITSSGGNAAVRGDVFAYGRDTGAAGPAGGSGGSVAISGTDVRAGAVDTTGGSTQTQPAGPSAPVTLAARGDLHVLGRIDASGQYSSGSVPSGGAPVTARAVGQAILGGGVSAAGGSGYTNGAPGGSIDVAGAGVIAGTLNASGGGMAGNNPAGGNAGTGGRIRVAGGAGRVSLSSVLANGTSAPAGVGGAGGSVDIGGGAVSAGQVTTAAGTTGGASGSPGGRISLWSDGALTVSGPVNSSGSYASGAATPPRAGAPAGAIVLRAANGRLSLGGSVRADGGDGGPNAYGGALGGPGGAGGTIDVVARTLGTVVSISSRGGDGGNYGDEQGVGGAGGAIRGWTDAPLFDDLKAVLTDGGTGGPVGPSGGRVAESSPTGLAINGSQLTFTSRSPDAQGFRLVRSLAGAAPAVVAQGSGAGGFKLSSPTCVPATFTVIAFNATVGWTSDAPPPVAWVAQPSRSQACADPPRLRTASKRLRLRLTSLRRAKWKVGLSVRSTGIGSLQASLLGRRKALATVKRAITKSGSASVRLQLPAAARRAGTYRVRLTSTAPDGKKKASTTITLEVRR